MLTDGSPTSDERSDDKTPLCVNLDGTLIESDVAVECFLRCLKDNAQNAFFAVSWLIRRTAHLNAEMARRVSLNVELLPVNTRLLAWLQSERRRGRRLVLCTAADQALADRIAAHFGIFEAAIGSNAARNLTGRTRASLLGERFGSRGFDYAGSEARDMPVWSAARKAIIVSPSSSLRRRVQQVPRLERVFERSRRPAAQWIRTLRLHQWTKNLLIFVPALTSHQLLEPTVATTALLAFIWFSLCASGTYLINDLLDLDADRSHARKRTRPLASGNLPPAHGLVAAALLIAVAFVGATISLSPTFASVLLIYLVGTLWYSFALKRIPMVDVLTLAGLYTVRVIAGGAAIAIDPSFWLLAFSLFLFLSLAIVKRYTELRSILSSGGLAAAGRGYTTDDLPLLLSFGTSAGLVSVLVLALYINSGAASLYRSPQLLWLLCPIALYWISRIWRKAYRGELHEDPVVFAVSDKPSLVVGCISAVLIWAAI
jgi:4-hydroxybenzoate polyprenyltransferase